jgi:hypothetical protein
MFLHGQIQNKSKLFEHNGITPSFSLGTMRHNVLLCSILKAQVGQKTFVVCPGHNTVFPDKPLNCKLAIIATEVFLKQM